MRFLPTDEQRAFGRSLEAMLNAADTPAAARAWAAGDPAPGLALLRRLAGAGVFALTVPESRGGAGPHPVELVTAFVALGRFAVPGPVVETAAAGVLLAAVDAARPEPPDGAAARPGATGPPAPGPCAPPATAAMTREAPVGTGSVPRPARPEHDSPTAPGPSAEADTAYPAARTDRPPAEPTPDGTGSAPRPAAPPPETPTAPGPPTGADTAYPGARTEPTPDGTGSTPHPARPEHDSATAPEPPTEANTPHPPDRAHRPPAEPDPADTGNTPGRGGPSAGTGAAARRSGRDGAHTGAGADTSCPAGRTGRSPEARGTRPAEREAPEAAGPVAGGGASGARGDSPSPASGRAGAEAGVPWLLGRVLGGEPVSLVLPGGSGYALDADTAGAVLVVEERDGGGGVLRLAPGAGPSRLSADPVRRAAVPAPGGPVLAEGPRVLEAAARAGELARLLCAAQALGVGLTLLERTVAYVAGRRQFGRPIAAFQAVRHRLADTLVALEFARPLVFGAAVTGARRDIAAAKTAAGEAAYTAARTALQLHGAIGYTDELDLSLWLRKARPLRDAWGTPSVCRAAVLDGNG